MKGNLTNNLHTPKEAYRLVVNIKSQKNILAHNINVSNTPDRTEDGVSYKSLTED